MNIHLDKDHGITPEIYEYLTSNSIENYTEIQQKAIEANIALGKSLFISSPTSSGKTLIADEIQIIGDNNRGPNIEILCTLLKLKKPRQLVALSATIKNAEEIANWLNIELIYSNKRDIELIQEIIYDGKSYKLTYGQTKEKIEEKENFPSNRLDITKYLIENYAPILFFVETRNDAQKLSESFYKKLPITLEGQEIVERLQEYTEGTEISKKLHESAKHQVIFHTADLGLDERKVIEDCLSEGKIKICFATSTLAAGVNFPFKTIIFPRLTYQYGNRKYKKIELSNYRNISGRAGRLGHHQKGFSILLPQNEKELEHARTLILPENDKIASHLEKISQYKIILFLISSQHIKTEEALKGFLQKSFYYHLKGEHNPHSLQSLLNDANDTIKWLLEEKLIEEDHKTLLATSLGKAIAETGLLPHTAVTLLKTIKENSQILSTNFEEHIPAILHAICSSEEFKDHNNSRFLPYPNYKEETDTYNYLKNLPHFLPLSQDEKNINHATHALILFSQGVHGKEIKRETAISAGQLNQLSDNVKWILKGIEKIIKLSTEEIDSKTQKSFTILKNKLLMDYRTMLSIFLILQKSIRFQVLVANVQWH